MSEPSKLIVDPLVGPDNAAAHCDLGTELKAKGDLEGPSPNTAPRFASSRTTPRRTTISAVCSG